MKIPEPIQPAQIPRPNPEKDPGAGAHGIIQPCNARAKSLRRVFLLAGALWLAASVLAALGVEGMALLALQQLSLGLILFVTLSVLKRGLPLQNVLLAGIGVALAGAGGEIADTVFGIPAGSSLFPGAPNHRISIDLPWTRLAGWIVLVINCRGVARLILRPWRQASAYGYWLIGGAALLLGALDFSLRVGTTGALAAPPRGGDWVTSGMASASIGALISFVCAIISQFVVIPWLLDKRRVAARDEHFPFALWALLQLGVLIGLAGQRAWVAVLGTAGVCITVALLVLRRDFISLRQT